MQGVGELPGGGGKVTVWRLCRWWESLTDRPRGPLFTAGEGTVACGPQTSVLMNFQELPMAWPQSLKIGQALALKVGIHHPHAGPLHPHLPTGLGTRRSLAPKYPPPFLPLTGSLQPSLSSQGGPPVHPALGSLPGLQPLVSSWHLAPRSRYPDQARHGEFRPHGQATQL